MKSLLVSAALVTLLTLAACCCWNRSQSAAEAAERVGSTNEQEQKSNVVVSTPAEPQGAGAEATAKDLAAKNRRIQDLEQRLQDAKLELQKMNIERAGLVRDLKRLKKRANEAFALVSAVWPVGSQIPVSWENPRPEDEQARQWVKAAIERTWQQESGLVFTGWGPAAFNSSGIRIEIADDPNNDPHCKNLGQYLNGRQNGMVLNFSFRNWRPDGTDAISLQAAIENVAIHEFGHAIGFAHEQNRPEAPAWCWKERQGSMGDYPVTIYDPDSIMNYCNSLRYKVGRLSPLDVQAVRILYPRSTAAAGAGAPAVP